MRSSLSYEREAPYDLTGKTIWVAGHTGMVGASLLRRLAHEACTILTATSAELDLRNQAAVRDWVYAHKPDVVIIAAAKVGGIVANAENPASFFYDNILISTNIIHAAYEAGAERLLYLGSSCIYPRDCVQPITEDSLLSGALEPTNEAYALAKIGGVKMVEYYRRQYGCDFISAMPCNLYGVGDTYDENRSHVIPAMIMKAHKAKYEGADTLTLWGTGNPLREFLYVDDLSNALVLLLQKYDDDCHINIGSGEEITIKNLAHDICEVVGYKGKIVFDASKPDGTPRKVLDSTRLKSLGWEYKLCPKEGAKKAYTDYLGRYDDEHTARDNP